MKSNELTFDEGLGHIGAALASFIMFTMASKTGYHWSIAFLCVLPVWATVYLTRGLWLTIIYIALFIKILTLIG